MSLIYTEGYLKSVPLSVDRVKVPKEAFNIYIVPENDGKEDMILIYDKNPYNSLYELHIANNPIFLDKLPINVDYYLSTQSNKEITLYYELKGGVIDA